MKNFQIPFNKFKKIKDDEQTAIMRHEDGHEFKIAKAALTPKIREQLAQIPLHEDKTEKVKEDVQHFAGDTDDPTDQVVQPATSTPTPDSIASMPSDSNGIVKYAMDHIANLAQSGAAVPNSSLINPSMGTSVPSSMPSPDANTSAANTAPAPVNPFAVGAEKAYSTLTGGEKTEEAGATSAAAAQGAQAQAEARAMSAPIAAAQSTANSTPAHLARVQDEMNDVKSDLETGIIKPQDLFANQSTWGKIVSSLGLLLGGVGGGFTHQGNPALQIMQTIQQQDYDSQLQNSHVGENLLSHLQTEYDSAPRAAAGLQALQNTAMEWAVQKAALQSSDPIFKANAQKFIGDLQVQRAQALGNAEMQHSIVTGGEATPNTFTGSMLMPKGYTELQVPVGNTVAYARSPQDAETAKKSFSYLDQLEASIHSALNLTQKYGGKGTQYLPAWAGNPDKATADTVQGAITVGLNGLYDLKRMNAQEYELYSKMAGNPAAFFQNATTAKLERLLANIHEKRAAEIKNLTFGVPGSQNPVNFTKAQ